MFTEKEKKNPNYLLCDCSKGEKTACLTPLQSFPDNLSLPALPLNYISLVLK